MIELNFYDENQNNRTEEVINKLKELVEAKKSFEEESFMYEYEGPDKKLIGYCMDFFYERLYKPEYKNFIFYYPDDGFENYNYQIKYKDKYSEVNIIYGQGSTCIIKPIEYPTNAAEIFDLENIDKIEEKFYYKNQGE